MARHGRPRLTVLVGDDNEPTPYSERVWWFITYSDLGAPVCVSYCSFLLLWLLLLVLLLLLLLTLLLLLLLLLLIWQFKTPECQVLVTNTGRVNVASVSKNLQIYIR